MSTEGIGLHELWLISTSHFFAVTHAKILKRELALPIEKRSAATETRQLHVASGQRFNAGDFVLCLAVRAAEHVGRVGRLAATSPRLEPRRSVYRRGCSSCLVRIKTKLLELPSPVRVWITQALDVDAAG